MSSIFKKGTLITFSVKEEVWIIVRSNSYRTFIKPYSAQAKKAHLSLEIEYKTEDLALRLANLQTF